MGCTLAINYFFDFGQNYGSIEHMELQLWFPYTIWDVHQGCHELCISHFGNTDLHILVFIKFLLSSACFIKDAFPKSLKYLSSAYFLYHNAVSLLMQESVLLEAFDKAKTQ